MSQLLSTCLSYLAVPCCFTGWNGLILHLIWSCHELSLWLHCDPIAILWHASSLYPQIHRSRRGKPRFGSPPRLIKKGSGHLRTIQDVWFLIFKVIPSHSMSFCHYSDGNPRSPSRKECTPVTALDVLRPHAQESCMERLNLSWNLQPK